MNSYVPRLKDVLGAVGGEELVLGPGLEIRGLRKSVDIEEVKGS